MILSLQNHVHMIGPGAKGKYGLDGFYEFLVNMGYELNRDIATCLYTGIITDTGSLKYPNVTTHTHAIVSKLIINPFSEFIYSHNCFNQKSKLIFV